MIHGHNHKTVFYEPLSVLSGYLEVIFYESGGGYASETDNDFGSDDFQLFLQPVGTGLLLYIQRIAVFGRAAFYDVCYIHFAAVKIYHFKHIVKKLAGSTVYVGLFPCNECAKAIIQSGIKEVVYLSDKYHNTPAMTASRKMLEAAGVTFRPIKPTKASIVLNFS